MELSAAEEYAIKIIAAESGMQRPVGVLWAKCRLRFRLRARAILRLNWGLDANMTQR